MGGSSGVQPKGLGHHVRREHVEEFLDGLTETMVVALPSSCVQAAGLAPNINDKHRPKELVGARRRVLPPHAAAARHPRHPHPHHRPRCATCPGR
jgi:hypothetical protein